MRPLGPRNDEISKSPNAISLFPESVIYIDSERWELFEMSRKGSCVLSDGTLHYCQMQSDKWSSGHDDVDRGKG